MEVPALLLLLLTPQPFGCLVVGLVVPMEQICHCPALSSGADS